MQKIKKNIIALWNKPFIGGFLDVESENFEAKICAEIDEELNFNDTLDEPDEITLICKLEPKTVFQDIVISTEIDCFNSPSKIISSHVYTTDKKLSQNLISQISIVFDSFQTNVSDEMKNFLIENPELYVKKFKIQEISQKIENFNDISITQSDIPHRRTHAHYLAGVFYDGINLFDIQQYFFFLGTKQRGEAYSQKISFRDLLNSKYTTTDKAIILENLSSLEDDIFNGMIKFNLNKIEYLSKYCKKPTIMSNKFIITFIKEKK